jgi:hypothetical protein
MSKFKQTFDMFHGTRGSISLDSSPDSFEATGGKCGDSANSKAKGGI